jgi:hypothetical protein
MPYNLSSDLSVKYAELERAAREISIHLPGWEFMKENQINYLRNGEYCILISEDRTGKRIQIQASAHLDKSLGEERGGNDRYFGEIINRKVKDSYTMEITVSANKEPSAIARDIQKRLIPSYIELYERCKKIFLENKYQMDQRVEFGKKAAAILDCNPPKLSTNNEFLRISEHLTIDSTSVSISCDMLYSNKIKLENISDNLLLEILTILTDKAGTKIYEAWAAKEKADYLFMLEHDLGITELPEFDWRKAYDEQWNYSRIAEALKLAISNSQTEDFMVVDQVVDQQELELTATNINYEDDDCDDGDNEEVSDRVLELLAHIESLNLGVIDILELINRLTAIAVNLLEQEEPDTDDDEEYDEDEDQE